MFGSPHEQKTFGLKAIANPIENQPAHHARSTTNVHRATHAESYAHCVNCDTKCVKTSNENLLIDSFRSSGTTKNSLKWSHRTIAGVSSQLHHVVTILDVSRFVAFCPTIQYPVAVDQSSIHFQISPTRFQTRCDSTSFEYLTPFDLTP